MRFLIRSWKYVKKRFPFLAFTTLLNVISLAAYTLIPQITQLIIDEIIIPLSGETYDPRNSVFYFLLNGSAFSDFWGKFGILAGAFAVLCFTRYFCYYFMWNINHKSKVETEKYLRSDVFSHMMNQNTSVLNGYTHGELMNIANSDCNMVSQTFFHIIPRLIDCVVAIIFSVFFLLRINPYLAIFPAVTGVITASITTLYIKKIRAAHRVIRERSSRLNAGVQENINGIRIVKAFAREDYEIKKLDEKNQAYCDSFFNHAKVWSKYQAVFNALSQAVNLSSVVIGIILATTKNAAGQYILSYGQFSTFTIYVLLINNPLIGISNILGELQQGNISGKRVFDFLEKENVIKNCEYPLPVIGMPNIRLNNVSVVLEGKEILSNIDIDLPHGKKLGIMGSTGSGKSALLKTVSRHFETTSGQTLINGTDVKELYLDDVRRQYSHVFQDVFLFSNTVDSNIAFYDPDGDSDRVYECAKVAQAHNFILKLPDGYATIVGEKGLGLSGGQKQRISIARALYKDAPVLLLDDCTSALDMETEHKLFEELERNYPDKTLVITTHKARSVMKCDEIIYLDNGRIVERGTHEQLMALGGRYCEVFTAQEATFKEAVA